MCVCTIHTQQGCHMRGLGLCDDLFHHLGCGLPHLFQMMDHVLKLISFPNRTVLAFGRLDGLNDPSCVVSETAMPENFHPSIPARSLRPSPATTILDRSVPSQITSKACPRRVTSALVRLGRIALIDHAHPWPPWPPSLRLGRI